VQTAIKGSKSGDWSVGDDGVVQSGGIALLEGEYVLQTVVADADPDHPRAVAMLPGSGFVILDTVVTPELAAEGLARDVVRAVQQGRREAGLDVSDRISLVLTGDADVRAAIEAHAALITSETLSVGLELREGLSGSGTEAAVGDNQRVTFIVVKA